LGQNNVVSGDGKVATWGGMQNKSDQGRGNALVRSKENGEGRRTWKKEVDSRKS